MMLNEMRSALIEIFYLMDMAMEKGLAVAEPASATIYIVALSGAPNSGVPQNCKDVALSIFRDYVLRAQAGDINNADVKRASEIARAIKGLETGANEANVNVPGSEKSNGV